MTNHVQPHQGEGSGGRALADVIGPTVNQIQTLISPPECIRIDLVVHREPHEGVYGYAMEVSDPHTKELLAKVAVPVVRDTSAMRLPTRIATALGALLREVLDPDPF